MDFSVIFQLRNKKFWWMDVIFYFVIALLIATVLCWLIFLIKNNMQKVAIAQETAALQTVGTQLQIDHEKEVLAYQQKVLSFYDIFKNHGFASQVFAFMQQQTRPNIWFDRFQLQQKGGTVDLSGEADDNDAFSRQILVFERNEYVSNINVLNSSSAKTSKVQFNLSLALNPKIFNYNPDLEPLLAVATESNMPAIQTGDQGTNNQNVLSSDKLMIIFKFPEIAESSGVVDLTNNTVAVSVPFGTNVTNLTPSMVISPKAAISPDSGVHQDFTKPIVYRITAEDGTTQDYTVTVNVLPKVVNKSSISLLGIIITSILSLLLVAGIVVGAYFIYKKKLLNKPKI